MNVQQWVQRHRPLVFAACAAAGVVVAMGGWPFGLLASGDAPACNDAGVVRSLTHTFNNYPSNARCTPAVMTELRDIREVEFRRLPHVSDSANMRWCEGVGRFGNGESDTVAYSVFGTRTVMGPAHTVRSCYGRFDPHGRDCSALRPPKP
jgi:hypothetical protein